ncbi:MAG: MBL fold metallo-hydrolase [Ignavibacteriales bacterium]|nr:MBL fold metallo-hydrolase [Ignavibacteriales bacterium]
MRIGDYDIAPIETGRFALDGGAMFGIVPWVFWSKTNPPDERQRIDLAARCLLIRGKGRAILVDDGNGTKFTDKLKDIYKLDTTGSNLNDSLARRGIRPEDITDVILTHLHFDHAGGSTVRQNGALVPAFPKAKYYVQRLHWELAQKPGEKDRGSFMKDDFLPRADLGVLEFIDDEGELFPNINLVVCNGHTSAQQLPLISDGKTTMLFCCDLIPTVSHVSLPYVMAYDVRPLVTIEEKKKILGRASEERWVLFLEHDPNVEAITVKPSEKGFVVNEKIVLG